MSILSCSLVHRTGFRPLLAAVAALACQASLAETAVSDQYAMAALIDEPYGEELVAGDYSIAIAALEGGASGKVNRKRRFGISNNLCVAYVMAQDADKAKASCEAAVRFAGPSDKAVALSNRGVIRALAGDTAGAKTDFQAARRLRSSLMAPVRNLSRLETLAQ